MRNSPSAVRNSGEPRNERVRFKRVFGSMHGISARLLLSTTDSTAAVSESTLFPRVSSGPRRRNVAPAFVSGSISRGSPVPRMGWVATGPAHAHPPTVITTAVAILPACWVFHVSCLGLPCLMTLIGRKFLKIWQNLSRIQAREYQWDAVCWDLRWPPVVFSRSLSSLRFQESRFDPHCY
jgi:hypothetical protein